MEKSAIGLGRLDKLLGFNIRLTYSYFMVNWAREVQPLGLTPLEFTVLGAIDANEAVSAMDISKRLNIAMPNVVALVTKMSKAGHVCRDKDKSDGRRQLLSLTPSGTELVLAIEQAIIKADAALISRLTPEEAKEFMRLLKRLQTY